jgi:hypothetical protein
MTIKLILTLLVVVGIFYLFYWIRNPEINLIQATTLLASFVAVISLIFLAYEIELIGQNFVIDHRPYIAIDSSSSKHALSLPEDRLDQISFTFAVENVGKSIAKDLRLKINEVCLAEGDIETEEALGSCFTESTIKVEPVITLGELALYPEGEALLVGLNISGEDLQSLYKDGKKIFLKFSLDYDGPSFKTGFSHYNSSYLATLKYKPINQHEFILLSLKED